MKYVCTVCGYIYDDAEHEIPFADLPEDWQCPLCKAPKSMFEPLKEDNSASNKKEPAVAAEQMQEISLNSEEEIIPLNAGELSILFSNLARGCEKQYQEEAKNCFSELASYFEELVLQEENASLHRLAELITRDLNEDYAKLRAKAQNAADRGTLRIVVWGEKVTKIAQSLIDRYLKDGDAFLRDTNLYICTVCGFLYVGDTAPELCPVCKVPGWKFEKITGRVKR